MHEGETMVIARSVLDLQNLIAGLTECEMKAQASAPRPSRASIYRFASAPMRPAATASFTNFQPIACWFPVRGQLCA
jgi:hypothetical protein